MRIILNQSEIMSMLQTVINQNVVPNTKIKDFEIKGLRMQEGYQLEIITEDVTQFNDFVEDVEEDVEIINLIFNETSAKSDSAEAFEPKAKTEFEVETESQKQSQDTTTEDIFSDKQAKLEEMTEEAIGVASTVKDASDVFATEPDEPTVSDDVDIFGNPTVKPTQTVDTTESLFS